LRFCFCSSSFGSLPSFLTIVLAKLASKTIQQLGYAIEKELQLRICIDARMNK